MHATTRFVHDAAQAYAREADFKDWSHRLHLHALDFRDLGRLISWLEEQARGPAFDIVINNAAQSVWHPPEYFAELRAVQSLPSGLTIHETSRAPTQLAPMSAAWLAAFETARADSWVQDLGEIDPIDLVEVTVVNAIAPFLICNHLLPNLRRASFADRYVVNVSAVEGQFARDEKPARHPHTNMAKAGLNMLTRTSAEALARDGIFMVSVDPGWVSKEGKRVDPTFVPPLTAQDAAARVLQPIVQGVSGVPMFGVLLKDFEAVSW